jgi:hypothetical protein
MFAPWPLILANMFAAVGIDLGTTFSVVGLYQNGKVEIVRDKLGRNIFPSIVSYGDGGGNVLCNFLFPITVSCGLIYSCGLLLLEVFVGYAARDRLSTHPDNTIYNAKRFLGRRYSTNILNTCSRSDFPVHICWFVPTSPFSFCLFHSHAMVRFLIFTSPPILHCIAFHCVVLHVRVRVRGGVFPDGCVVVCFLSDAWWCGAALEVSKTKTCRRMRPPMPTTSFPAASPTTVR